MTTRSGENMHKKSNLKIDNKAFTLIELIVVMTVIALLVLLAAPQFIGHTKIANEARFKNDTKVISQEVEEILVHDNTLPEEWVDYEREQLNIIGQGGLLYDLSGPVNEVNPGDYKLVETSINGTFYANDNGDLYAQKGESIVVVDETGEWIGHPSAKEFNRTVDLAPIIDKYGTDVTYTLSYDIKSVDTTNHDEVRTYMQSGSGSKYSTLPVFNTVLEEYQRFTHHNIKFHLTDHINRHTGQPYETAHLAFYGIYDTGNKPIVKNIKLIVHLDN